MERTRAKLWGEGGKQELGSEREAGCGVDLQPAARQAAGHAASEDGSPLLLLRQRRGREALRCKRRAQVWRPAGEEGGAGRVAAWRDAAESKRDINSGWRT